MDLYQLPESDAEFVKPTAGFDGHGEGQFYFLHPRVVDSVSCRQLYLRSAYTFSRKESLPERTKKCFERVKERVTTVAAPSRNYQSPGSRRSRSRRGRRRRRLVMVKRVKEFSCEALRFIFQRLLSCTASVDVVERN